MRKTGIKLAGLAVALVGAAAVEKAEAGDVTISTATTTPLQTSSPDGVSAGNVTVAAGGSISVQDGQSAITLNSNNNVTNSGTAGLNGLNQSNVRGVNIIAGFSGTVSNTGAINFAEDYSATDTDNDGDLDGEWAQGSNKFGIYLSGAGTHTGDISNTGTINIEGDNSYGIRLDSLLTGDLINGGAITIVGDNSAAIAILGGAGAGVNGDVVLNASNISVRGVNSRGLLVDAPISGELSIRSAINVSGFHVTARPSDEILAKYDADDFLLSGAAVEIRGNVAGGVTLEGIGVEDDPDDDGDGVTEANGDSDDDVGAQIQVFSNAPAVLIASDPGENLVLGATASGYGFHSRGTIAARGIYDGIEATGVRVQGSATSTATSTAGILIDNTLAVSAAEADAFGISVGQNAIVPSVVNRKNMTVETFSEGVFDAYGVLLEAGAQTQSFSNSGSLQVQAYGEVANAYGVVDRSNTLATINNTGTIRAAAIPTDDDFTDDVIPVATGSTIAIDVSTSTIGVTLNQTADVPFNDDDAVDDDVNNRPLVRIEGDVLFGSGGDTLNLLAGGIIGDVDFGAGANVFTLNGGAAFAGQIRNSGSLTLDIVNGTLGVDGGTTNFTSGHFHANSVLAVFLSEDASETTQLLATGSVTFDPGALITPVIPEGLPVSGSSVFLTAAGGLVGAENVERTVTGDGATYIYNLAIARVASDPNSLEARYVLKTAAELGLNGNQAAAFAPILEALRQNEAASLQMALIDSELEFETAYDDLLPTFTAGATELAATAIQQSQSAATNRLAATRLHNIDQTSVWVQEIGYGITRTPSNDIGTDFRGYGFGLATGIDAPLGNGAIFGLSAAFITSQVEEPGRADGELAASFGQANAYLGTALGPIDLDFVGGLGVGRMSATRGIVLGSLRAKTEADWWAYEGHGAVRASLPLALSDWFIVTPHAALTYLALNEDGYEEEGGGAAFDYEADSQFSQRLWADVGVEFSARWRLSGEGMVAPRLMLGYRANVLDEEAERTYRFASGGNSFTFRDEALGDGAPLVGIGIDATNGYSTFSLAYEGEFGDEIDRHSLNAAIRFRF